MEKSVLKSKTFWMNVLMAISPLVPQVGEFVKGNPELFASIWAVLGIAIRFVTKEKIVLLP